MRWTPHMEECMQKLSDSPQWSGDLVLVALVKIYKVLEDFSHIQWMNSEFGGRSTAASSKPIPIHFVKSLRANIDEIRKSLTPELLENSMSWPSFLLTPPPTISPFIYYRYFIWYHSPLTLNT